MNPVVHFEMPYEDRDRMASFYEKTFGWQIQKFGEEMGNYAVAATADTDRQSQLPKNPGSINGGFFKRAPENAHPSVVISVPDIKAAMRKVRDGGGTILENTLENGEPINIPDIGLYAGFTDTEGNRVSLLQPASM